MSNTTIHRTVRRSTQRTSSTEIRSAIAGTNPRDSTQRSDKITDEHLQRLAIVYVRQSTQQQVLEHRESTARQ